MTTAKRYANDDDGDGDNTCPECAGHGIKLAAGWLMKCDVCDGDGRKVQTVYPDLPNYKKQ